MIAAKPRNGRELLIPHRLWWPRLPSPRLGITKSVLC